MPIVKHHNPKIDTGVRLLSQQGYSAKEIANELGTSLRTIFNYASDLSVKIGRKYHSNNAPYPQQGNQTPLEDPKTKGPDPEEEIRTNIMKKHVKVMGEKLATLTVEHELEMRKIVVALEKHAAIFESIEEMGLTKEKFIDVCIEIGYDAAKEAYMKKVREAEERKAMKDFLEMRRLIKGMD